MAIDTDDFILVVGVAAFIAGVVFCATIIHSDAVMTKDVANEICHQLMKSDNYNWYDNEVLTDRKFYCKKTQEITYDNTPLIQVIGNDND